MKKLAVLSALCTALTTCVPTRPSPPPEPSASVNPTFLAPSGRALMYHGQTVYLRGVNLSNEAATYEDSGYDESRATAQGKAFRSRLTEDERDYARLESWGVNTVRLGLDWHWFAADKEQFLAFLDQHIAWAKAHHMWLILNMAVPRGGIQDYTKGTRFWRDPSYRNSLKAFWVQVAQRYAEEPAIAGYDLLNEPSSKAAGVDWWSYAGELRDAIWAVDKNHFVVIESQVDGLFSDRLPLGSRVKYPNVVYSIHHYTPESMTHNGVSDKPVALTYPGPARDTDGKVKIWDKATMDQRMRVEGRIPISWAQQTNLPLLIGEWGSVKRTQGYLRWTADQIELMRAWGVHWTFWAYRDYDPVTDFGLFNARHGMTADATPDLALIDTLKAGLAGNISPT